MLYRRQGQKGGRNGTRRRSAFYAFLYSLPLQLPSCPPFFSLAGTTAINKRSKKKKASLLLPATRVLCCSCTPCYYIQLSRAKVEKSLLSSSSSSSFLFSLLPISRWPNNKGEGGKGGAGAIPTFAAEEEERGVGIEKGWMGSRLKNLQEKSRCGKEEEEEEVGIINPS